MTTPQGFVITLTKEQQDTQSAIRGLMTLYQAELERVSKSILALQQQCTHPVVTRIPKSDTGNYDRSQDRYWYDCRCVDCDKRWLEDQ